VIFLLMSTGHSGKHGNFDDIQDLGLTPVFVSALFKAYLGRGPYAYGAYPAAALSSLLACDASASRWLARTGEANDCLGIVRWHDDPAMNSTSVR
jgi:hypothetical protein